MSGQYLYLLVAKDRLSFKIGVSKTPETRMRTVAGNFDYAQSWQVLCDEGTAYRIEKTLHFLFREHQLSLTRADGYTEWFAMDCFSDVLQFLHDHRGKLGWLSMAQANPAPDGCEEGAAAAIARAERRQSREDRAERRQKECLETNLITATLFEKWIAELSKAKKLLGTMTTVMGEERQTHIVSRSMPATDPHELGFHFPITSFDGQRTSDERVIERYLLGDWPTELVFSTIAHGWPKPFPEERPIDALATPDNPMGDPSVWRISKMPEPNPSTEKKQEGHLRVLAGACPRTLAWGSGHSAVNLRPI